MLQKYFCYLLQSSVPDGNKLPAILSSNRPFIYFYFTVAIIIMFICVTDIAVITAVIIELL